MDTFVSQSLQTKLEEIVEVILKRLNSALKLVIKPEMDSASKKNKLEMVIVQIFKSWAQDGCKNYDTFLSQQKLDQIMKEVEGKD